MDRFGRWSHQTDKGAVTRLRCRSFPRWHFHSCVSTRTVEVSHMSTRSELPAHQRRARILDGRLFPLLLLAAWALLFITFAP